MTDSLMCSTHPRLLLRLALLAILLGGCAGSAETMWRKTQHAVGAAAKRTKEAVTTGINVLAKEQREGWKEESKKWENPDPKEPPKEPQRPAPAAQAPPREDRFPAARRGAVEEKAGGPKLTSVTQRKVHGTGPKEIVLLPRTAAGPEGLRRQIAEIEKASAQERDPRRRRALEDERKRLAAALRASEEEERIIREMEDLRGRLRSLQKRLLEVQGGRR